MSAEGWRWAMPAAYETSSSRPGYALTLDDLSSKAAATVTSSPRALSLTSTACLTGLHCRPRARLRPEDGSGRGTWGALEAVA